MPKPRRRQRLVQQMVRHAKQAFRDTSGRSLSDLTHCMAALGVDEHGFSADGVPRVLGTIERRLAGLNRDILQVFRRKSGTLSPETACALLLNLVARIAESNRIDMEVLTELAVAKLLPLAQQIDGEVVGLARELKEARRETQEARQM